MLVQPHWTIQAALGMLYFSTAGGFNLGPRPSLLPPLFGLSSLLAAVLFFLLGEEWGSVWCWASSVLCVAYLIEPWLYGQAHVLEAQYLLPNSRGRELRSSIRPNIHKAVFSASWKHMEQANTFGGLPWRKENEEKFGDGGEYEFSGGRASWARGLRV